MSLQVDKSAPGLQAVCHCAHAGRPHWSITLPTFKQMADQTLTYTLKALSPKLDRTAAANRCNAWKGCCDMQEGCGMQSCCCDSKAAGAEKKQDLSCTRRRLDSHLQSKCLEAEPKNLKIRNPVAG